MNFQSPLKHRYRLKLSYFFSPLLSLIVSDLHWFARCSFTSNDRPTDRPTPTNFDMLRYLPESSCLVWHSAPLPLSPFSSSSSSLNFPSDHRFCSINFLLDFFLSLHSFCSLSTPSVCVYFCVQRIFNSIVSYTNECTLHTYTSNAKDYDNLIKKFHKKKIFKWRSTFVSKSFICTNFAHCLHGCNERVNANEWRRARSGISFGIFLRNQKKKIQRWRCHRIEE